MCISGRWIAAVLASIATAGVVVACCPAPPAGRGVVNADQTVIMIWDAAAKTQHFIRQASFKTDSDDFGFIVPSPSQPELAESGNDAFAYLKKLTAPIVQQVARPRGGSGCGCAGAPQAQLAAPMPDVRVLEEKQVAGFNAVVLEADSSDALVKWLKEHGYAWSPEIEAWAKPYVGAGWKFTALKVAKKKDGQAGKDVSAAALRLTFKTDRPLFPYREPDPKAQAAALNSQRRLLRVYFLADGRFQGILGKETAWPANVAWSNAISASDRKALLDKLKLPENTGPATWWLTEFEHDWPYQLAPADVYFARSADQGAVARPPIIEYVASPIPTDLSMYAIAAFVVLTPIWRRLRRQTALA